MFLLLKMWQHPSAQVIFDTDPAILGKLADEQMEEMSQAMIRLGDFSSVTHDCIAAVKFLRV